MRSAPLASHADLNLPSDLLIAIAERIAADGPEHVPNHASWTEWVGGACAARVYFHGMAPYDRLYTSTGPDSCSSATASP